MATKKIKTAKKGLFGTLLDDVKENISEGTKVFEKKSSEVLGSIRGKSAEVYEAGAHLVENVNEKVHHFTEKQRLSKELREMEAEREGQVLEFGEAVLQEYLKNSSISKRFLTTKKIDGLVISIKDIDKSMAKTIKDLSKLD